MTFLDTGILVGAVLASHEQHEACRAALEEVEQPFTNAHALAESFATLTGFYKVPVEAAAQLIFGLAEAISVEALSLADYEKAIGEARRRGVMGGGIYESLHATFARRKKAAQIVTRNPSHFVHVAPDMEILTP
ncbi:type II toxin-antitoxin system VapC family toxin [Phragmitibacter flavus]|uniref:Type II toxin-antitoxin system VapC family toxin n=1 Tax=Phragmitibacter flavus TaxID=2576071 RepID=A0A5R8KLI2_9BACT|nr:PIN domain-containing protein [Phragmitibacter flavus]TLD72579.1 type II toxin-antitoxin system VapC family toxin [Phragmitibacter flavus]